MPRSASPITSTAAAGAAHQRAHVPGVDDREAVGRRVDDDQDERDEQVRESRRRRSGG